MRAAPLAATLGGFVKKKTSPRKLASCINNAAKSTGPVTDEGKARSSQNALRHGLTAAAVVLPSECRERFDRLFEDYIDVLEPTNVVELECVRTVVVCAWRRRRVWAIESAIIALEIHRHRKQVDKDFEQVSDSVRCALAVEKSLQESSAMMSLRRYERGIETQEGRALRQLHMLQGDRPPLHPPSSPESEDVGLPNEPNPITEQSGKQAQQAENTAPRLNFSDLFPKQFMDNDEIVIISRDPQIEAEPRVATATATPPMEF
jgi:hypothetical protein